MIRVTKNKPVKSSALRAASLPILALLFAAGPPGFWSGAAWAQDARQAQRTLRPSRINQPTSSVPAAVALPSREAAGGALGTALASCDKEPQSSELILPGAKGDLKLDRCYRGRDHLVCSFNALLQEAKSLLEDYRKIVEARYPEVSGVGDICGIKPTSLAADMQNATDFAISPADSRS